MGIIYTNLLLSVYLTLYYTNLTEQNHLSISELSLSALSFVLLCRRSKVHRGHIACGIDMVDVL